MNREDLVTTVEVRDERGRVVGSRDVVRYPALLNGAHDEGLKRIETAVAQFPSKDNGMIAVVQATVETEKGTFTGTGEASSENTDQVIGRYLVAQAETRAKARALRDALNVGTVSLEEIVGENGNGHVLRAGDVPREPKRGQPRRATTQGSRSSQRSSGKRMSEAQRRYLFRLLAEQGIKNEAAEDYLKEAFKTESLKEVSKGQASGLIEELLGESKE